MSLQYPLKFDMLLAPLIHDNKTLTAYVFTLYCKENIEDTRSITNGFVLHLEKLLPINHYFEITKTPSNISKIKIIFTFPKSIYKNSNKGTIYNKKNLSAFPTLIKTNWYSNLSKLKCDYLPIELSYETEYKYIQAINPVNGDLEALITAKTRLMENYIDPVRNSKGIYYEKVIMDSYFKAHSKLKKYTSFLFMLKLPDLNKSDSFVIKALKYNLESKLPVVVGVTNSLNKIKGNYEFYIHVPGKLTKDLTTNFIYNNIEYESLTKLISNEWDNVLLEYNILEGERIEGLIGKNPIKLECIDFNTTTLSEFNQFLQKLKNSIVLNFIKEN